MQVQALIDYFALLAQLHNDIVSFNTGDTWEVAIAGEDVYPQLWLDQAFNVNQSEPIEAWDISFMVLAKQLHNESDEREQLDLTHTIANQIIQKIKNDEIYTVGANINMLSFTNAFEDLLVGWRVELQLRDKIRVDRCNISYAFDNRCNYSGDISGEDTEFLNEITLLGKTLTLPSLPMKLVYTSSETVPNLNTILTADLAAKGYNATILQSEIPGPSKSTFVRLVIVKIEATLDQFLCLIGSEASTMFIASCNCSWEVAANEADIGGIISKINVNDGFLSLSSLPFNFSFSNTDFEADRAALEAELQALGYEATVADVTPPGSLGRTISIIIANPPTGDEFIDIVANLGAKGFDYNCT